MTTSSPFTRTDLPILGRRRDGTPFYLIAGGAPDGGEGGEGGQGGAGAAGAAGAAAATGAAAGAADGAAGAAGAAAADLPDGLTEEDLADLVKLEPRALAIQLKQARQEAASARVASRDQAKTAAATEERQRLLTELTPALKALGIELPGDKQADPAQLSAQLEKVQQESQAAIRTGKLENGVLRLAPKAGGDADKLLDSTSFAKRIAELDPDAADFGDKMAAAVKAHVEAHPHTKLAQVAGKAGARINGGSGEQRTGTPLPLDAAVASHYAANG